MGREKWVLGSHNSMSYLRPKTWWGRLFRFVAQCQQKNVVEQWESGVRYYDLRVGYDSEWNVEFRHGAIAYQQLGVRGEELGVERVLEWLEKRAGATGEPVWVRVILEKERKSRVAGACVEMFRADCKRWEQAYPSLLFHCGRRKRDWKQLYDFGREEPSMEQAVSSMTWKVWDDWCPRIYAWFMNKKKLQQGTDKQVLLIDFV